ncbi:hypothetical protein [uncultured Jannaschia sp.]|uniref:hypothetical protein n=1 Tax=uncultured Jannaschia sp. TaxID=293347 RepID=UPI00260E5A3A|nr:hypothetical protein [uncultured Jannaschia sp.]
MARFGGVFRFKVFGPVGWLRFVSGKAIVRHADLATHNSVVVRIVETKQPFTALRIGHGEPEPLDVYIEIYLPVFGMETYPGQTEHAARIRADHSLFYFPATIGHDPGTPMNGIVEAVQLLDMASASPKDGQLPEFCAAGGRLDERREPWLRHRRYHRARWAVGSQPTAFRVGSSFLVTIPVEARVAGIEPDMRAAA